MTTDHEEITPARRRGEGRGSKFFVLDRDIWAKLWEVETRNRLNLVTAFLVLLAGTGADHRLTKWSTKACEERAGLGKPRAKVAIEELISGGLAELTETSTRSFPHYRLAAATSESEPIFLPVQFVTGMSGETPMLRRVRETGDALLLRMLVDLYGLIETDASYGISIAHLRDGVSGDTQRKILEMGANAVWALQLGNSTSAGGTWTAVHATREGKAVTWETFWERVRTLQKIGALWFEPWVFDGVEMDAEPLFPTEVPQFTSSASEVRRLSYAIKAAVTALVGERTYLLYKELEGVFVVVPTHHRAPAIRKVAKLRVEADTPGRRAAYARRLSAIETTLSSYQALSTEALASNYSHPIKLR